MTRQFRHIRASLEIERKLLTEELQLNLIRSGVEVHEGSPFGKRAETATERFEFEKRLALVQNIKAQLSGVECALEKLHKGTYGVCDSCGEAIPLARLEAIPQTNLCLDCKVLQATNVKTPQSKSA